MDQKQTISPQTLLLLAVIAIVCTLFGMFLGNAYGNMGIALVEATNKLEEVEYQIMFLQDTVDTLHDRLEDVREAAATP